MKLPILLNASPFSDEATYNALRLASCLATREGSELRIYLMGDAVLGVRTGQKPRTDGHGPETSLKRISELSSAKVHACGSCLDHRGIAASDMVDLANRASLDDLADTTMWADKVMVF